MPSQLLQDLATRIGTALAAGPDLRLDEATLGIPGLGPLVQAATGVAGLAISAASLDVEDDSLTVSGSSLRPITLSVRDDGGAVLRLEVSAFDAPVPLSGLVESLLHGGFSVPAHSRGRQGRLALGDPPPGGAERGAGAPGGGRRRDRRPSSNSNGRA